MLVHAFAKCILLQYIARIADRDLSEDIELGPEQGVFLSAGAGPWGISLSQGIGHVFAQLILGRRTSIDLRSYHVS